MEDKRCFSCKKTKSIDDFYKTNKVDNRRHNECKECTLKRRKQQYYSKKEGNFCPGCLRPILPTSKQCRDCLLKSMRVTKCCLDCGIKISNHATRCKQCQNTKHGVEMSNPVGHKRISTKGYIMVKVKYDGRHKEEAEHRLIIENAIGRELKKGEHVHHIDGDKQNNNINNLALLTAEEHAIFNRVIKVCNTNGNNNFAEVVLKSIIARFPELLINLPFPGHLES